MSWVPTAAELAALGIEEAVEDLAGYFSDDFATAIFTGDRMVIWFNKGSGKEYTVPIDEDEWERFRDSGDRGLYWNRNLRSKA